MTEKYDVIAIGSGLGGLSAGALCARDGLRVLVVEKHTVLGGAATVFKRPGMTIEAGLHEIDGFDPEDSKRTLFEHLGILKQLEFVKIDSFFAVRHQLLGDEEFVMPDGIEAALAATCKRFPEHRQGLEKYFTFISSIRRQIGVYENYCRNSLAYRVLTGPALLFRVWPLLRHDRTTVDDLLTRLFGNDERVKIALVPNLGYYSDNLNNFSLLYFAAAQASYHIGGSHYIKGGSQRLSDALAKVITNSGGTTLTGRRVDRVILENNRAVGIVHTDARHSTDAIEARAPIIFGNAAPHALARMLPDDLRSKFMQPYSDRPLAPSLWSIYLGLNKSPGSLGLKHYSTFFMPDWLNTMQEFPQFKELMSDKPNGRIPGYVAVNYSSIDSGLSSEDGRALVVACGIDQLSNWENLDEVSYRAKKAAWLDAILNDLDRRLPGFASHVVFKEMATARTMQHYLGTPGGTPYGFAQQPTSAGRHRPKARTTVPGLWLASVFAAPGGGFSGAMKAGILAHRAASKSQVN